MISLENTEWAIKNRQSSETGNIWYTRRRKTNEKHNIICVGHHYVQTNINNVNKTRTLLQATRGNDQPNIVLKRTSRHGTQNVNTHNMTMQKTKF